MYTNAQFWREMIIIGGSIFAGLAGYFYFKDSEMHRGSEREW